MTITRAEAMAAAAKSFATALRTAAAMSPRELAEAAWCRECRKTVDQLEDEIREERGLPSIRREGAEPE